MAKEIVLVGLRETLDGLKKFDEAALKKFTKTINKALQEVKKDAQKIAIEASVHGNYQNAPLSGWKTTPHEIRPRNKNEARPFPVWDAGEVISNIRTSKARGRKRKDYTVSGGAVINDSAPGRVFELAGRGTRNRTPNKRSQAFKNNLNNRFGVASRLVYRAADRHRAEVQKEIEKALEEAKKDLQRALEKQHN